MLYFGNLLKDFLNLYKFLLHGQIHFWLQFIKIEDMSYFLTIKSYIKFIYLILLKVSYLIKHLLIIKLY